MITQLDQVTETRLTWPENKPRATNRGNGPFDKPAIDRQISFIRDEMSRWRARDFILSRTSLRMYAADPGVALWWVPYKPVSAGPNLRVLACDVYNNQGANARAIYLTLDAMRALNRWGAYSGEQAAEGARVALPPPPSTEQAAEPWWVTLGVQREWPLKAIEEIYRTKAEKAHPDRGGSVERMQELNGAITTARKELSR